MNDQTDPTLDDDDPVLTGAGSRLRQHSRAISPAAVETAVLRRRSRQRGMAAIAAAAAAAVLGGLLIVGSGSGPGIELAAPPGRPAPEDVQRLLASLDDQPVDPTEVELVSTVSTFPDCDALIGDLRRVGAEHVGSRGFGDSHGFSPVAAYGDGARFADEAVAADTGAANLSPAPWGASSGEVTLGTNVQVAGVDEPDLVKAAGSLIYDLDGRGHLRITEAGTLTVLATLDLTPGSAAGTDGEPSQAAQVRQLLVADGRLAIFGTEVEVSDPVEGDPSATRASTSYLTVTFVNATDPSSPTITDRVRIEGGLVSARLVGDEIRLVTTSHLADIGFVMPTTPASVATALDQNRRSVASSGAADWIPDWQRDGGEPQPLVPCERVHVPDTFAGVAMTSMVTFPLGTGRFTPTATSFVAPATTLYAGLEKVAISSEVWVDPIDRDRLEFDDWQTAVHEFAFAQGQAPTYVGSGIVDGSTVGQFAFGEIGDSLAVVTTEGTPWSQRTDVAIDLTVLTPDGDGTLAETSQVVDLAGGKGAVAAVRFVPGRVLVSTGFLGREVHVIDVTDPGRPRRAGSTAVPGTVGYFHPLPDGQALLVASRSDEVGQGDDRRSRSWVQAHLLDVGDAEAPRIVETWERPWTADEVGGDHHAFTYWPDRQLAMWGMYATGPGTADQGNEAAVLHIDGGVSEVAVVVASKPAEAPPPCPTVEITDPEVRRMVGTGAVVLHCGDTGLTELEWPRYQCYAVDDGTVARFVPEDRRNGTYLVCSPAPHPTVRRVLVVAGTPILLTEQTLEALDPQTFTSTAVAYHPSSGGYGYW